MVPDAVLVAPAAYNTICGEAVRILLGPGRSSH